VIIGVDFDNTIVCYDGLFHKLAVQQGLIPRPAIGCPVASTKNAVRDYLRQSGEEDRWTELQGYVYGPGMSQAQLYPGVLEFFDRCRHESVEVFIISHRTRHPFRGEQYDLHEAARVFLAAHGFDDPARIGLPPDHICFLETKAEKIARINEIGCTHFIDDLPEVLTAPELGLNIEKIFFDPSGQHGRIPGLQRATSWPEIEQRLCGGVGRDRVASACPPVLASDSDDGVPSLASSLVPPYETVAALLASASIAQEFDLTPIYGGGNNRVFRVDAEGRTLLLKAYFHHPDDPRNRLAAEFTFSRFAWNSGIRCIPEPIACDDQNHLGLYEFIDGRALGDEEIGASEVDQAAEFFAALNRQELDEAGSTLGTASEAYFTLAEHLDCIQRRVQHLRQLNRQSQLDHMAADWLESKLSPAWFRVRTAAERQATASGLSLDEPLEMADRCISPSDFGFHNAILGTDGRLRFIDFEYAGWDDPAKMICDFVCQPRLPVPDEFAARFTDTVLENCSDSEFHRRRIEVLLPVYRLKWCCIMMNEFLPVGSRRRSFACDTADREQRKRQQLEKSDRALQLIGV
jgi:hypothetical protein